MSSRRPRQVQPVVALVLGVVLLGGCSRGAGRREAAPPIPPGPFGWLTGDWWGEFQGGCADERWTAPVANTLMGMFRYTKDGAVQFYEFSAIEPGSGGPTLLLRHFKPGLLAWEEKDKPLAFHLVSQGAREAIFEHDNPDKPARITYRRPNDDELVVTVEHRAQGQPATDEFHYSRIEGGKNPCHLPE